MIKTKIREAEKAVIYEKYVDQVGEMVEGIVESAEDRFILVLLEPIRKANIKTEAPWP